VSDPQTPNSISQEPVNILFSPSSVIKKDVWEIDLIQILNLLIKILEKTGKKECCTKKLMFFSVPKILVMSLKRFSNEGEKIDKLVDIPLANLNLEKYVIGYDNNNCEYDLYGVCNHMGGCGGGHYTAYVKLKDGKWWHFNDKEVTEFNGNVISEMSYCLFYRKKTK